MTRSLSYKSILGYIKRKVWYCRHHRVDYSNHHWSFYGPETSTPQLAPWALLCASWLRHSQPMSMFLIHDNTELEMTQWLRALTVQAENQSLVPSRLWSSQPPLAEVLWVVFMLSLASMSSSCVQFICTHTYKETQEIDLLKKKDTAKCFSEVFETFSFSLAMCNRSISSISFSVIA